MWEREKERERERKRERGRERESKRVRESKRGGPTGVLAPHTNFTRHNVFINQF